MVGKELACQWSPHTKHAQDTEHACMCITTDQNVLLILS